MKKNVLFFVIDSLSYERLTEKYSANAVPFLKKVMEENISFSNMYSQAPYTEAALMGLVCGVHTMDHNGYMMRYRDVPETFLETFAKNDYEVYQLLQPHIYPSSLERNIPNSYYNVAFDFNALWSYRLSYFADLYSKGQIEKNDYHELSDMMLDNFRGWILFLERVKNKDESVSLIIDNLKEYNVQEILAQVQKEYEEFLLNNVQYLNELFEKKKEHPIFKIPTLNQIHKIHNSSFKEKVISTYTPFFESLAKKQKMTDIRWNRDVGEVFMDLCKTAYHDPSKQNLKKTLQFLNYVRNRRNKNLVLERIAENYDAYKAAPSVQKHMEHFLWWYNHKHDKNKNYLAYIHVDDIHNPEMFFSYDSENFEMVSKELNHAKKYVENLPDGYKGSITYDLALQYMDQKLEWFFEELRKSGILKNTTIYITADHGFSFYNKPLRDTVPNNFYRESYHVPFIIVDDEIEKANVDDFHQTMDIPATILEQVKLPIPIDFSGVSVFKEKRSCIMMEYMGGGCPDIYRRPIKYGIRNEKFSAVYSVSIYQDFWQGKLEKYFDLEKDSLERKNLAFTIKNVSKELGELLKPLEKRHQTLREYYHGKKL